MSETAHVHFVDLDLEDRKRAIAYQLWDNAGRPDGMAETHWAQACEIVAQQEEQQPTPLGKEPAWLKRDVASSKKATTVTTVNETKANVDDIKGRIAGRSAA